LQTALRSSAIASEASAVKGFSSASGRNCRHFDFIACVDPRLGAAHHVQEICEAALLQDTGAGARAITTGADDGRLHVWFQIQVRDQIMQIRQRRTDRMRGVSTLVLGTTSDIDNLKVGSRGDQFLQLSHIDLRHYVEFETRFLPRFDSACQITLNVFQTYTCETQLRFGNSFI